MSSSVGEFVITEAPMVKAMFWDGTGTPPFSLPRQSDLRQFSSSAGIEALTLLQQPEQSLDGLPGLEAGQVISENVGIRTNSARAPRAAGCSVNTVRWCWSGSSRPGLSWGTWRWRRGVSGGESDSRRYPELSPTSLQSPQDFGATESRRSAAPGWGKVDLPSPENRFRHSPLRARIHRN
jgi:hypothetical protein